MDTKLIGTWSFFAGIVLAIVTVFVDLGDWAAQVLIILGIVTGAFNQIKDDLVTLGIVYFALSVAAGSMNELAAFGPLISDLASAAVGFLGPVVLMAFMLWGMPRLMVKKAG